MARMVRDNSRTVVKGGHAVGKTQCAAGLVVWFLHAFSPAIVITTAPSREQVQNEIWREIRSQSNKSTRPLLPGILPKEPKWDVGDMTYALGMSTDTGHRFRGKHGANMLFLFDEGPGIPAWAWEEAENMCTASNNKILVIGNPIDPGGVYFDCFKGSSGWHTLTLSCLDHPNVVQAREVIPGAVTRRWVDVRVKKYCTPVDRPEDRVAGDFEWPRLSGEWHHPGPVFQCRVMGEFPDEGPDNLISMASVNIARKVQIPIDDTAAVDLGVDVAYRGGDYCCVFARRGPCVISRRKWRGTDPDKTKREVAAEIKEFTNNGYRVGTVAVDAIGIGSGVAHGLRAMKEDGIIRCDRVLAIQVSEKATNDDKYANKRAELAFALAERFKEQRVDLTRLKEDADDFENQAVQIQRDFDGKLRYKLESKDDMRGKIGVSPDDFDAMMLCFIDTADLFAESYAAVIEAA